MITALILRSLSGAVMVKVKKHTGGYSLTHRSSSPRRSRDRRMQTRSRLWSLWAGEGSLLHRLPSEVLNIILGKLSVLELSVLCMTSKEISRFVVEYVSTKKWRSRMIMQTFHNTSGQEQRAPVRHYRALGLLFKRSTLLLPTVERLRFICHRFLRIPCFMLEQCFVQDCHGFACLGVVLKTLIAGWNDHECHKVFIFLCNVSNILPEMATVVNSKPGVHIFKEMEVRLFCRRVLLDSWSNRLQGQFWLVELLRPWSRVTQSHLLLLLYGPLLPDGTVGWQELVEGALPPDSLWDLAQALLLLFSQVEFTGWTPDYVLAIIDELTVIPYLWHEDNVARLLIFCGSRLCFAYMASRALRGCLMEVSRLFVQIIIVCEKDGYHMKWVTTLLQQVCHLLRSNGEQMNFLQNLESMFAEMAREFFEIAYEGNALDNRDVFQTLCSMFDSIARFHTEFFRMCISNN